MGRIAPHLTGGCDRLWDASREGCSGPGYVVITCLVSPLPIPAPQTTREMGGNSADFAEKSSMEKIDDW